MRLNIVVLILGISLSLQLVASAVDNSTNTTSPTNNTNGTAYQCTNISTYDPNTALVPCYLLPQRFIQCKVEDLFFISKSLYDENTTGCRTYGTGELTTATCTALLGIDCFGPHSYNVSNYPCIKYGGYYFPTALLFSLLLGCFGIDRFYLGHCGYGVLKLLSLGGLGVWWIFDIGLLVTGYMRAADQSSWETQF